MSATKVEFHWVLTTRGGPRSAAISRVKWWTPDVLVSGDDDGDVRVSARAGLRAFGERRGAIRSGTCGSGLGCAK